MIFQENGGLDSLPKTTPAMPAPPALIAPAPLTVIAPITSMSLAPAPCKSFTEMSSEPGDNLEIESDAFLAVGALYATYPGMWYAAEANSRDNYGSKDDTWTNCKDGTVSHATNGGSDVKPEYAADLVEFVNEDPSNWPQDDGGETYLDYPIGDYISSWEIIKTIGNVEAILLSGAPAHFGLYTASFSCTLSFEPGNIMLLTTIDDLTRKWWFRSIAVDSD